MHTYTHAADILWNARGVNIQTGTRGYRFRFHLRRFPPLSLSQSYISFLSSFSPRRLLFLPRSLARAIYLPHSLSGPRAPLPRPAHTTLARGGERDTTASARARAPYERNSGSSSARRTGREGEGRGSKRGSTERAERDGARTRALSEREREERKVDGRHSNLPRGSRQQQQLVRQVTVTGFKDGPRKQRVLKREREREREIRPRGRLPRPARAHTWTGRFFAREKERARGFGRWGEEREGERRGLLKISGIMAIIITRGPLPLSLSPRRGTYRIIFLQKLFAVGRKVRAADSRIRFEMRGMWCACDVGARKMFLFGLDVSRV